MPAYNAQETISRAIMSVWFQTYPNWKIIIRDDMSTDRTLDMIDVMKKQLGLGEDRISVTSNTEKMWEIRNIVESVVNEKVTIWFDQNPSVGRLVLDKVLQAAIARDLARKARDSVRRKGTLA